MHHPFNEDLKLVLDSNEAYAFLPSGSWMAGGCSLLAESLQRLMPDSQLKVVGRIDDGILDHVVLMVSDFGEDIFIDYDGVQTLDEMITKMQQECFSPNIRIADCDEMAPAECDVRWLQHSVPAFTDFLSSKLGIVDADRVSLTWADDDHQAGPGL
jgi:hypothetical protein